VLDLQLRVPARLTGEVVELLTSDDTVTNVAVLQDAYAKPRGCLVIADVAREGANPVVASLKTLDLHHNGSIMLTEPSAILSDEADRVEEAETTLVGGFAVAVVLAAPLWAVAHAVGLASRADAVRGPLTDFIVQPDEWSFLIAVLVLAGTLTLLVQRLVWARAERTPSIGRIRP
jgi:hypothetical protein